jgi:DNA-binding SARP family transcriptional activator
MTYWRLGQPDLAEELFVEAARMARQGGYERAEVYALVSLADIARQGGSLDSAISRYDEAEKAATSLGEHTLVTHVLTGQSHTYRLLGEHDRALVLARRALASAEERDSPYEKALALIALGRLNRQLGRLDEGVSELYLATQLLEQTKAGQELVEALFYLAEAALPQRLSRTLVKLTLERLASLVAGLGYDQFLLAMSREAPALARYGASKNLAGGYYNDLLRRLAPTTVRSGGGGDLPGASKPPVVEVRALGTVEVRVDGREITPIEWESEKSKEMLLLLLTARRPMPKEEVIAALWPEATMQRGSSSFHSTLHRLRGVLYKDSVIESAFKYSLNPSGEFVSDVVRFMKVTEGRRLAGDNDLRSLKDAVDFYGGPFAPGVTSEWADDLRTRFETRFLAVASRLLSRLLNDGAYAEAIDAARKIVENDPYNEAAYIGLMKAHLAEADQGSALRAYQHYTELLHSDLGEQPGAEIQGLYAAARRPAEGSSARS